MTMNKKLLSLVLALIMVFSVFTTLFAEEETTETTEATETAPVTEEYIEFLKEHGLVKGDAKGDLMLDKEIDRASFAALLVRADNKEATATAVKSLGSRFKDMTPAHWGNGYANVASEQGWMKGNEKGEFMPSKTISYAEIATTLVRFLGTDTAGYVYPASYIAKAFELGLFEGVREITDYAQPAIRKDIFRMIYNAISKEDFGRYTVYKMIVLENNRVAQLAANEVKAEVLSVVQVPNKVSERGLGKVGEQFKFDLTNVKVDPEFILGKVANFSVDEKGNLVKVVVDDSYDYVWGPFGASDKNFKIAGRNYGVRVDERYWKGEGRRFENDDRMYRTYVTAGARANNYHYVDFVRALEENKISPNLARVTAKDGMVIFIDTFELKDIAPVKEVAREGQEVYYYNDARDGAVERMTPARRIIGYTAKDGFHVMKANEIKANDTIHWMSGFTLVRRDAELTGKLNKTYRDQWGEFAVIGEDVFFLNSRVNQEHPFVSVFAYDNTNFRAMPNRGAIEDMRGDDVLALLDVFGDIQLITSHRKYNEAVALISKVVSAHGMEYWAPNKEDNYRLSDNYDAKYGIGTWKLTTSTLAGSTKEYERVDYTWNGTHEQRYAEFNYADLVYVQSFEEDKIGVTAQMVPYVVYNDKMAPAYFEEKYARYLTVGDKEYRYNDETDVFVYNTRGKNIYLGKMTMEEVIKYNKDNLDLQAFVVSEKEYKDFIENTLKYKTYYRLSERDDYARIVIFKNYNGPQDELGRPEYAKVVRVNNYANSIEVETSRGNYETLDIVNFRNVNLNALKVGVCADFIQFRRVLGTPENENKAVFDGVLEMEQIAIKDKFYDGFTTTTGDRFYFDKHTKDFGDSRDNFARIFRFKADSRYVEIVDYNRFSCTKAKACELTEADKVMIRTFKNLVADLDKMKTCCDAADKAKIEAARAYYNGMSACAKAEVVEEEARLQGYEALVDPYKTSREAFIAAVAALPAEADVTEKNAKEVLAAAEAAEAIYNALPATEQANVATEKTALDKVLNKAKALVEAMELAAKKAEVDAKVDAAKAKATRQKEVLEKKNARLSADDQNKVKKQYDDAVAKIGELETLLAKDTSTMTMDQLKQHETDIKVKEAEVKVFIDAYNGAVSAL